MKRGGKDGIHHISPEHASSLPPDVDLLDLNEALNELEQLDPEASELVKFRFFSGLTMVQIAEILEVSERTTRNIWVFAQAWLYRRLNK